MTTWEQLDEVSASPERIDREAGVMRGVILAQEGPFRTPGRGQFSRQSIERIVEIMDGKSKRSRFTHPQGPDAGLGKALGKVDGVRLDRLGSATVARGDITFFKSARRSPYGDLASYVMDLTEEDPTAVGMSLILQATKTPQGGRSAPLWMPQEIQYCDVVESGEATHSMLGVDCTTIETQDLRRRLRQKNRLTIFAG